MVPFSAEDGKGKGMAGSRENRREVNLVTCGIGFQAPKDFTNRYYNPALGGGATYDILVYCYEIARYFLPEIPQECVCRADWSASGVDKTDVIVLKYPECMISLIATFEGDIPNTMIFYGEKGRIELLYPHYGKEAFLYIEGEEPEKFAEDKEENGFVYDDRRSDPLRKGRKHSRALWRLTA